jgi:hypothetical protein
VDVVKIANMYGKCIHCVQSSTAMVVWFHFRLARMDARTREVGTFFENVVI